MKSIKKILCVILSFIISLMCLVCSVSAADATDALEFIVSDDGYAIVYDCKESAAGVLEIPETAEIDGYNYIVRYIGVDAFDKCDRLTEIRIPEGVTAIKSHAFRDCTSLENVYIPESLIRCEYDAFDGCGKLTVHCYMSNYSFISLGGINSDITVNIIDESDAPLESDEDSLEDLGFVGVFIKALKNMIQSILDYFDAGEDDFEFSVDDLPFDLPFDIPVEDDSFSDFLNS